MNCETKNSTTNHKQNKLCTEKNQITEELPNAEAKKEFQSITQLAEEVLDYEKLI